MCRSYDAAGGRSIRQQPRARLRARNWRLACPGVRMDLLRAVHTAAAARSPAANGAGSAVVRTRPRARVRLAFFGSCRMRDFPERRDALVAEPLLPDVRARLAIQPRVQSLVWGATAAGYKAHATEPFDCQAAIGQRGSRLPVLRHVISQQVRHLLRIIRESVKSA